MGELREVYEMLEAVNKIDINKYQIAICNNMRMFRTKYYDQYRYENPKNENPYSTENISTVLGMSNVHYKRLENPNDKNKCIRLHTLILLSVIYNKTIEEFIKN